MRAIEIYVKSVADAILAAKDANTVGGKDEYIEVVEEKTGSESSSTEKQEDTSE